MIKLLVFLPLMTSIKGNSPNVAGLLFGTSAFGMGMLYMPATFNQLGYIGMLIITVVMFVLTYTSLVFINMADEVEDKKGVDITKRDYSFFASFNKTLSIIVAIAFILSNFAVVYLFLRRATDLTVALINIKAKLNNTTWLRFGILTFYALLAIGLFMQKDLSVLKPLSYVSLFACFYYAGLMVACGITSENEMRDLKPFNNQNGLNAILNFIFAAHCQFSFLGFKKTLRDRNDKNAKHMILIALLTIYLSYTMIGFFGYKYLGSSIGENYVLGLVIENFSNNKLVSNNNLVSNGVFQVLLILLTMLFVVIFFTGVPLTVFTFLPEIEKLVRKAGGKPNKRLIKGIVGIMLYGLAVPKKLNEGLFLAFVSAFCTNFLSFGFPGLFASHYTEDKRVRTIGYGFVVFSSVLAMILTIIEIKNRVGNN